MLSCDGFILALIHLSKKTPYLLNKVWYFDFETTVIGTHRETMEVEELHFDDDFYDKLWAIHSITTNLLPFQHRLLRYQ
jgi:hypothetical protein